MLCLRIQENLPFESQTSVIKPSSPPEISLLPILLENGGPKFVWTYLPISLEKWSRCMDRLCWQSCRQTLLSLGWNIPISTGDRGFKAVSLSPPGEPRVATQLYYIPWKVVKVQWILLSFPRKVERPNSGQYLSKRQLPNLLFFLSPKYLIKWCHSMVLV